MNILLAISGLTPQVVTECLYALAPTVIDQVHVVTTGAGERLARESLPAQISRCCTFYGLPQPILKIHCLRDREGQALDDIRSAQDSLLVSESLAGHIRRLTFDPGSALYVSLAGGRKTMSFSLGFALCLYGRPQDRLLHVLVEESLERDPAFFFPLPDQPPGLVELVDIPFLRLRHGLHPEVLQGETSLASALAVAQQLFGPPRLRLNLARRQVTLGEVPMSLPPIQMAFLSWMARRRKEGFGQVACPPTDRPSFELAQALLAEYRAIVGPMGETERTERRLARGLDKNAFLEWKSEVNRNLQRTLGPAARPYQIVGFGKRPSTTYGLEIEPAQIDWIG